MIGLAALLLPGVLAQAPDAAGATTAASPEVAGAASGQAPETLWTGAEQAALKQDFTTAAAQYRQIIGQGVVDADVYYNLGNMLYRQQQWAGAILAWRRAARLDPRDPDVEANLVFARRKVKEALTPEREAPWFAPWQGFLSPGEGQWLGMGLAGLGLTVLGLRRRGSATAPAAEGAAGLAAAAVAAGLLCWGGGWQAAHAEPGGVVLAQETRLTSDLSGGVELFTLHAGAEVRWLDEAGDRVLIGLPDGRKGWMAAQDVGRIDPFAPFPALP